MQELDKQRCPILTLTLRQPQERLEMVHALPCIAPNCAALRRIRRIAPNAPICAECAVFPGVRRNALHALHGAELR